MDNKKKKFSRADLELKSVGMKAQKQLVTKPMKAQKHPSSTSTTKDYGEDSVTSTDTDKGYYDGPSANLMDEETRKAIQDTTERARRMRKNKDFKKLEIREGY